MLMQHKAFCMQEVSTHVDAMWFLQAAVPLNMHPADDEEMQQTMGLPAGWGARLGHREQLVHQDEGRAPHAAPSLM